MKKLLILLALFVLTPVIVQAWTITWDPVTTYTDNTTIESAKLPVRYEIKKDGAILVTGTTANSFVFLDTGHGLIRSFTAKATLQTGEASAESPAYSWTVPLGAPRSPGNLRVAP